MGKINANLFAFTPPDPYLFPFLLSNYALVSIVLHFSVLLTHQPVIPSLVLFASAKYLGSFNTTSTSSVSVYPSDVHKQPMHLSALALFSDTLSFFSIYSQIAQAILHHFHLSLQPILNHIRPLIFPFLFGSSRGSTSDCNYEPNPIGLAIINHSY